MALDACFAGAVVWAVAAVSVFGRKDQLVAAGVCAFSSSPALLALDAFGDGRVCQLSEQLAPGEADPGPDRRYRDVVLLGKLFKGEPRDPRVSRAVPRVLS
jgi:hypothetical protein